jgi:hypothetical protein
VCKEGEILVEVIQDVADKLFKGILGDKDGSKAKPPGTKGPWKAPVVGVDAEEQPRIQIDIRKDGKPVKKLVAVDVVGNVKAYSLEAKELGDDMFMPQEPPEQADEYFKGNKQTVFAEPVENIEIIRIVFVKPTSPNEKEYSVKYIKAWICEHIGMV